MARVVAATSLVTRWDKARSHVVVFPGFDVYDFALSETPYET
jgi:hypothetical protein